MLSRPSLLAALLCILFSAPALSLGQNLLKNGEFSASADGKPAGWVTSGDANVVQQLSASRDEKGEPFAQLVCTKCEARTPASHAMLAQMGVPLTKGKTYEFAIDVKGQSIAAGLVSVAISSTQTWTNCGLSGEIPVGDNWRTFRRVFTATQDVTTNGRLQIWFHEPGALFVRNARLVEYSAGPAEFTQLAPGGTTRNLVPNGSFELGTSYWSSLGKPIGWGNLDHLHGRIENEDGRHFLRIPMGAGRSPRMYFDYYQPVARTETSPLAANLGWIPVERGQAYTLSCRMRSSVANTPAVLGIVEQEPGKGQRQQRKTLELTSDWKTCSFTFKPQTRYVFVTIGPNLPEDRELDVDIDDVQLERSETASDYVPHNEAEFAVEGFARRDHLRGRGGESARPPE